MTADATEFPFLSWLGRAKNTRGILYFQQESPPDEGRLQRLIRRHRYRSLGLPARLLDEVEALAHSEFPHLARLLEPPFTPLPHPFPDGAAVLRDLFPIHLHRFVDAVLCSLEYAAPMILFSEGAVPPGAESLVVWERRTSKPLDDTEFIRHLRIAAYAVIDFYDEAVRGYALLRECAEAARRGVPSLVDEVRSRARALAAERVQAARTDGEKRYWRIPESPDGARVLAYLDLLPALAESILNEKQAAVPDVSAETTGLGLGIAAVVWMGKDQNGRQATCSGSARRGTELGSKSAG